jgi:transposase
MSHAVTIIGIPGLQVERVARSRGIDVRARPYRRPPCQNCHGHDVRIKATHRRTVNHTQQGNQVMTLHLRVPKYHCRGCRRYFRHTFDGTLPCFRGLPRLEVFEAHHSGVILRKVSRTHHVRS